MNLPLLLKGKISVTLVCFLAYFIMSGLLTPMGVISLGLQETFEVSSSTAASVFSWLLTGVLIGTGCSNFVYRWLSLKQVFLACYVPLILCIVGFTIANSLSFISFLMGACGMFIGLGLATGAVTLTRLYDTQWRGPMLVCTDINFSIAGAIIPTITAMTLASGFPWYSGYLVIAGIATLCALLVIFNRFPSTELKSKTVTPDPMHKLNGKIWILAVAMFLFLFGQNTFSIWSPTYLVETMSGTIEQGGSAISQFWSFALVGQLLTIIILARGTLTAGRFLLITTPLVAAATIILVNVESVYYFTIAAALYGFLSLGGYKTMVSFGSLQSFSPQAVTILLTAGTAGSMSAPSISSWSYELFGINATMMIVAICAAGVALCTAFCVITSPVRTINQSV